MKYDNKCILINNDMIYKDILHKKYKITIYNEKIFNRRFRTNVIIH